MHIEICCWLTIELCQHYMSYLNEDILQIPTIRARQVGSSVFVDINVITLPELSTTATKAVEERLKAHVKSELQPMIGSANLNLSVNAQPKFQTLSWPKIKMNGNIVLVGRTLTGRYP